MGFWFFMQLMILLAPLTMILCGHFFLKGDPSDINALLGYRTTMSTKNQDTWEFAHKHCGRLWLTVGWMTLPISLIPLLFLIHKDTSLVGNIGSLVIMLQTAILIISIVPTEHALHRSFHSDGSRKEK